MKLQLSRLRCINNGHSAESKELLVANYFLYCRLHGVHEVACNGITVMLANHRTWWHTLQAGTHACGKCLNTYTHVKSCASELILL